MPAVEADVLPVTAHIPSGDVAAEALAGLPSAEPVHELPTAVAVAPAPVFVAPAANKRRKKKKIKSHDVVHKVYGNYDECVIVQACMLGACVCPCLTAVVVALWRRHVDLHPGTALSMSKWPPYFSDERVKAFLTRKHWFAGKTCLDVGCSAGYIAIALGTPMLC